MNDEREIVAAIDRNSRVRHWQPDGRYPGYETRINEHGHRETRPMKTPDGVPAGYERQMVQVWKGPKDIVIIGTPDENEDEETGHNCDAMGCGWDHVLWRIPLILALCFTLPAAPLLTATPEPQALQYWHTVDIPTDGGVYPLEVYAPALPPLFAQPQVVEIGTPPKPPVHVPEPGTWVLIAVIVAYIAIREWTHKDAKMRLNISALQSELRATEARVSLYYYALKQIEEIGGDSFPVAIARKALEE